MPVPIADTIHKTIVGILGLILLLLVGSCGSGGTGGDPLTFTARRQPLVSSVTAQGEVEALRVHAVTAPRLRGIPALNIAYLAPEFSFVNKGDIVVELDGDQIRGQLEQAERELASARSDLEKMNAEHESAISQLKAQIERAKASIQNARLKLAELEFIAPRERQIRELQIQKSMITEENSRKKMASTLQVQEKERSQQLLKIKQEESRLATARQNLQQLKQSAPVDGYVQYYESILNRGEFYKPGDLAIPGLGVVGIAEVSKVRVKLQLSETQVQNMEAGQPVEIEVESLGGMKLLGKVGQVAQVAKPIRRSSNVKKVEVLVDVEETVEGLVPGYTATCTIMKNSVDDQVVVPLETVFDQDSTKVVYTYGEDGFVMKEVQIGDKGNDFVVIQEGLAGGEQLALRKPDKFTEEVKD